MTETKKTLTGFATGEIAERLRQSLQEVQGVYPDYYLYELFEKVRVQRQKIRSGKPRTGNEWSADVFVGEDGSLTATVTRQKGWNSSFWQAKDEWHFGPKDKLADILEEVENWLTERRSPSTWRDPDAADKHLEVSRIRELA